jgi:hypothetical protein
MLAADESEVIEFVYEPVRRRISTSESPWFCMPTTDSDCPRRRFLLAAAAAAARSFCTTTEDDTRRGRFTLPPSDDGGGSMLPEASCDDVDGDIMLPARLAPSEKRVWAAA